MKSATTKTDKQPANSLAALSNQVSQVATLAPSPLAVPEVAAQVVATTDYDLFQPIDSNRPVIEEHVLHLMRQIRQKDLLHLRPIDVNPAFGVIDGQHRLEAAKRLGRPIYYQVSQLTDDDMAALNRASRNWKTTDYLHYWASKGKPAYVACNDFLERHPRFSLSLAMPMLVGLHQYGRAHTIFRDGLFDIDQPSLERAESLAGFFEKVKEEAKYKKAYEIRFVQAVSYCFTQVAGFDLDVLLRKILLQPTELVPCVTVKQYLPLLERLYNYKTMEKNQVRFR